MNNYLQDNEHIQKLLLSKAGYCALCFLICGSLFSTLAIYLCALWAPGFFSDGELTVIASISQYIGALPFCLLIINDMPKKRAEKKRFSPQDLIGFLGLCAVFSEAGYIIGAACADLLTSILNTGVNDLINDQVRSLTPIENLVTLVIIAPVFEEIIFRKILLDRTATLDENIAVFLSGVLFGVIHCNVYQLFYATFIGIVLGIVYIKSRRICYSIAIHASFNFLFGYLPSLVDSYSALKPYLVTVVTLVQYSLILYGIVYLIIKAQKHSEFIKSFFISIKNNLHLAMLNNGVLPTVIVALIIYVFGLYQ